MRAAALRAARWRPSPRQTTVALVLIAVIALGYLHRFEYQAVGQRLTRVNRYTGSAQVLVAGEWRTISR